MRSAPLFKSRVKITYEHRAVCGLCGFAGPVVKHDEDLRLPVCTPCVGALDNAQHALQAAGLRPPAFTWLRKDAIPERETIL